jgi:hypothetical protein
MLSIINNEPSDKEGRGNTYYLQVLTDNISIYIPNNLEADYNFTPGEYHDFKTGDIIKVIYLNNIVYFSFSEKSAYFFDQSTNALLTIDRNNKLSAKLTITKLISLRYITDITKSVERENKLKILLS